MLNTMNKRIISFICVGLVATSCVSSLCFYDYFANDGTTSNPIYWIFDFFQLSIPPLLQAWSAAVITEYPQWLLISQVGFSIALFTALFIIQSASLFKKSGYIPRLLMAAFYINCVYTALTVIGLIITL